MKTDRFYEKDGVKYPSVTTITGLLAKPALYGWYGAKGNDFCRQVINDSTADGSEVHAYIDNFFSGKEHIFSRQNEKITKAVNNFRKFVDHYQPKRIHGEHTVFHDSSPKYAGTLDWVGEIGGKRILIDWKTSKDIYQPEYELQGNAYANCEPVDEIWVVGVSKDKDFKIRRDVWKFKPSADSLVAFLSLASVWYWKHNRKGK